MLIMECIILFTKIHMIYNPDLYSFMKCKIIYVLITLLWKLITVNVNILNLIAFFCLSAKLQGSNNNWLKEFKQSWNEIEMKIQVCIILILLLFYFIFHKLFNKKKQIIHIFNLKKYYFLYYYYY